MTPSITIQIDFGSEGGAASRVSTSGSVPAPVSFSGPALAAGGGAIGAMPTAAGTAGRIAVHGDTSLLAPTPTLFPHQTTGGSRLDEAPTPFSASGLSSESAGQSGVAPTPLDSAHGTSVGGDHAPTPSLGAQGHADLTLPSPQQPDQAADKKARK